MKLWGYVVWNSYLKFILTFVNAQLFSGFSSLISRCHELGYYFMAAGLVGKLLEELFAGLDIDQFLLSSRTDFLAKVHHYDDGDFSTSSLSELSLELFSQIRKQPLSFCFLPHTLSLSIHPVFILLADSKVVTHKHRTGPLPRKIIPEQYYIFSFSAVSFDLQCAVNFFFLIMKTILI